MAEAPWRCSQCGTVNEPVANACRTCGRWPSLFELEGSTIEADVPPPAHDDYAARTVEVEYAEPEVYDPVEPTATYEEVADPDRGPDVDPDAEPPKPLWQRLGSLIVPIGVVLYILVSSLANRGDGG